MTGIGSRTGPVVMGAAGRLTLPACAEPGAPLPPLFAPVIEVGGSRYTAGLHTSPEEARVAGEALADVHPSVSMHGVVELLTAAVAAELASAHDVLEQMDIQRFGGTG
ncbi:hypothetical protein FsymDg_1271 [Candidatus Protofrankia datiscae]|uniref:Uncharacterized protein n=1 Tax=Candidatus Protofrankia datiscae TaxID=2716812 RepID=F8B0D0_9ACTN|nr:hypothetical protein FsymDg_1271 [Candidatus Protofrankia datiscae]